MTPEDIKMITFPKARFGGYDMAAVDRFLEEVEKEIAGNQELIGQLRSKMRILVDEIERLQSIHKFQSYDSEWSISLDCLSFPTLFNHEEAQKVFATINQRTKKQPDDGTWVCKCGHRNISSRRYCERCDLPRLYW